MSLQPSMTGWRAAALLLAVAIFAGGCQPANRLDRVVRARTLAELRSWQDEIKRGAGASLEHEIDAVFMNLAATTPRYRPPATEREWHEPGNPLCLRVNGKRLREVMIDSYTALSDALELSNNLDAENLLRLSRIVDTDKADVFDERIELVKRKIAERDETIRQSRARIEQLQSPLT